MSDDGENPLDASVLAVNAALFGTEQQMWKPISTSKYVFQATEVDGAQALISDFDGVMYAIIYKIGKKKENYKIDLYSQIPFANMSRILSSGKRPSMQKIKEAFENDIEDMDKISDFCNIILSEDVVDLLFKARWLKHDKEFDGMEDERRKGIAVCPCFTYEKHRMFVVGQTLLNQDFKGGKIVGIIPSIGLECIKKTPTGLPNSLYDFVDALWLQHSMVTASEWICDALDKMEEAMESDDGKAVMVDDNDEDKGNLPWKNPFEVVGDFDYGVDEKTGKYTFNESQMKEMDSNLTSCIQFSAPVEWSLVGNPGEEHPELAGLSKGVVLKKYGKQYYISKFDDTDRTLFVLSIFNNGKKEFGKVFYPDDYANFVLCESKLNSVFDMFVVFMSSIYRNEKEVGESVGKKTSRKTGTSRTAKDR